MAYKIRKVEKRPCENQDILDLEVKKSCWWYKNGE